MIAKESTEIHPRLRLKAEASLIFWSKLKQQGSIHDIGSSSFYANFHWLCKWGIQASDQVSETRPRVSILWETGGCEWFSNFSSLSLCLLEFEQRSQPSGVSEIDLWSICIFHPHFLIECQPVNSRFHCTPTFNDIPSSSWKLRDRWHDSHYSPWP